MIFRPKPYGGWVTVSQHDVKLGRTQYITVLVPEVMIAESGNLSFYGNYRILAACIAVLVALITRSVIATICFGMVSLWLLEWAY